MNRLGVGSRIRLWVGDVVPLTVSPRPTSKSQIIALMTQAPLSVGTDEAAKTIQSTQSDSSTVNDEMRHDSRVVASQQVCRSSLVLMTLSAGVSKCGVCLHKQ